MLVLWKLSACTLKSGVKEYSAIMSRHSTRILQSYVRRPKAFSTTAQRQATPISLMKASLVGIGIGVPVGLVIAGGYSWHVSRQASKLESLEGKTQITIPLTKKPEVKPSRRIISPADTTGLKLTLFQYQTCPFCCKVRVFLDYYGLSYDVVEVDPVLRKEISWSAYRKVPILLVEDNGVYQQLNDSSMIVSLLASHLQDKTQSIKELVEDYPVIAVNNDGKKLNYEIMNKYFLMYNRELPKNKNLNDITEERKWRQWADDTFVHTLSPNVYRTLNEAYQTFNWFSQVGKWEEYFPSWERYIMINVGSLAMWMISKRLQKKYNLKQDVRTSLYDEVNTWLKAIKARGGKFMGGSTPDLSDLAVYGVLKSIEGCAAFKDVLTNTKLSIWYEAMSKEVEGHSGSKYLAS